MALLFFSFGSSTSAVSGSAGLASSACVKKGWSKTFTNIHCIVSNQKQFSKKLYWALEHPSSPAPAKPQESHSIPFAMLDDTMFLRHRKTGQGRLQAKAETRQLIVPNDFETFRGICGSLALCKGETNRNQTEGAFTRTLLK